MERYFAYQLQQDSFIPDMLKQLFCILTSLGREMGVTLTHDVTGRQVLLVSAPS